jgi:hypothetical protein
MVNLRNRAVSARGNVAGARGNVVRVRVGGRAIGRAQAQALPPQPQVNEFHAMLLRMDLSPASIAALEDLG